MAEYLLIKTDKDNSESGTNLIDDGDIYQLDGR
jgi:hypothetical protein